MNLLLKIFVSVAFFFVSVVPFSTPSAMASNTFGFTWATDNPASITAASRFRGTVSGSLGSVLGVEISRFCVLINGSTDHEEARVFRSDWNVSWIWREEKNETCFNAALSTGGSSLLGNIEFLVYGPQNLPPGQIEFKIRLFDTAGNSVTSTPFVVQNDAAQPTIEVAGLSPNSIFSQDGEQLAVDLQLLNLYDTDLPPKVMKSGDAVSSWCVGLNDSSCLPVEKNCGLLLFCTVTLDTREIPNGFHFLHVNVLDRYGRKLVRSPIPFEIRKSSPIVLGIRQFSSSAKWTDKTVRHLLNVDTRIGSLATTQDVRFGLKRSKQTKRVKYAQMEIITVSDGSQHQRFTYRMTGLKPSTTYWVRLKFVNPEGTTLKIFKVQTRSIPKKPLSRTTPESGGSRSTAGGCYAGMNWGSCVGVLGFEPRSADCKRKKRLTIINSNWWIRGFLRGVPVLSRSAYSCR